MTLDFPEQEREYPINQMDIRTSDIFILAGLVLAVAAAGDLARHYLEYGLPLLVFIVIFAYTTGLRRGMKKR